MTWRSSLVALLLATAAGCISEEREREIGDAMASNVNPHLPIIDDHLLNAYVYAIGRRIGEVSGRPDLELNFYIVNTDAANAYALPGGHIYVTRGLIERTGDGGEFAGVLAHEIGHVAARHGVQKLQRELRTGSLVNVLYNAILGGEPNLLKESLLQRTNLVWSARHSRRDEREADRLAMQYLMRVGVDPNAMVLLLQRLLEEEEAQLHDEDRPTEWFSTHPMTANRIVHARRFIQRSDDDYPTETALDLSAFPAFRVLVIQRGRSHPEPAGW